MKFTIIERKKKRYINIFYYSKEERERQWRRRDVNILFKIYNLLDLTLHSIKNLSFLNWPNLNPNSTSDILYLLDYE